MSALDQITPDNVIVIAHISDLHLSREGTEQNYEALREKILELKPKPMVVVASGDFLNYPDKGPAALGHRLKRLVFAQPQPLRLSDVKGKLEALRAECHRDCKLIVVPGNHDYRQLGLYSRRNHDHDFEAVFKNWGDATLIKAARPIAIFCLNSNKGDARINAARGLVGKEEYLRFRKEVKRLKEQDQAAYDNAFKIVVLHHHPLPIADSEDAPILGSDRFLGLDDAGIFMREMATEGVDLVLHGHKHYTFNAKIEVAAGKLLHNLAILAAGSACKEGGENSFNVITVRRESVKNELYVRTTGIAFYLEQSISILSYDSFRDRQYRQFLASPHTTIVSDQVMLTYSMLEYGDCDVAYERRGVKRNAEKPVEYFESKLSCPHGTIAGYKVGRIAGPPINIGFRRRPDSKDGLLDGEITFDPALDRETELIDIRASYRLYNGFALTQEQRLRISGHEITENVEVGLSKNAARQLTLSVHFGSRPFPTDVRPTVTRDDKTDFFELHLCQPQLQISELAKIVTLTVEKPIRGVKYGFEWDLPPGARSKLSALRQGQCDQIRAKLLELKVDDLEANPLQPVFREKHEALAREYTTSGDSLHLGLMVFDEKLHKLRYVAGIIHKDFWTFALCEGQGIAGRAHKLNATQICVPHRLEPKLSPAASPPEGHGMPSILVCTPLVFPLPAADFDGDGEVIGVVTLSATDRASNLLKIDDDERLQKAIPVEFQLFFMKTILPVLGLAKFVDTPVGT